MGALIIDSIITSLVVDLIGLISGRQLFEFKRTGSSVHFHFGASGWYALVWFGLPLVYYAYLWGSASGQTVGKKLLNIRVVDFDGGGPIGFGRGVLRYIGSFASGIVCGLGYLWMLWDKEKQTWHDKIAQTVVVPTSAFPVEKWPG